MLSLVVVLTLIVWATAQLFFIFPIPALAYTAVGSFLAAFVLAIFSAVTEIRVQLHTIKILKDQIKRNQ